MDLDDSLGSSILLDELSCYPGAPATEAPALVVEHHPLLHVTGALNNPSTHLEHGDGFTARYVMADVRFVFSQGQLRRVRFYENATGGALLRQARRWADLQFTSRPQRAGVIFHEMVLMPAVFFMPDLALVHAAAVQHHDGGVTLVGGTGGVGKTSLELALCREGAYRFVADDVCAVGDDGHVWPNLAYPKLYAYNVDDDPRLRSLVMGGRGVLDRVQWHARRHLGPDAVRRRVAPDVLYGDHSQGGGPLRRYVILARENRPALRLDNLDAARAARMTTAVIETEYHAFNNHLHWHAFNRSIQGVPPIATVRQVADRWERLLTDVLQNVSCHLVRIPADMRHDVFKREVAAIVTGGAPPPAFT